MSLLHLIGISSLIFIIVFLLSHFSKISSSIPSIAYRLVVSGIVTLTIFLCLLAPSKLWLWTFNFFFMWYLKGVLENNLEQMNHRKSRELLYKSYKSKSSEAVNKRDIEPNTKKVEDQI